MAKVQIAALDCRLNKLKGTDGVEYAGAYYPANGNTPARYEATVFVNEAPFTDDAGVRHEPEPTIFKMQAWNSRNSKPGRGMADLMAKYGTPGKEFSGFFRLKSFMKRMFVDNKPLVINGETITFPSHYFILDSLPTWGNESAENLSKEIAGFIANPNGVFGVRPINWNTPGHADQALWKAILQKKAEAQYVPGMVYYGSARVITNDNSAAINHSGANIAALLANPAALAQLLALNTPAPVQQPVQQQIQQTAGLPNDPVALAQLIAQAQALASAGVTNAGAATPSGV